MKTIGYIHGWECEIREGKEYYLGQIWEGNIGNPDKILKAAYVRYYNFDEDRYYYIKFKVLDQNELEILDSLIKVELIKSCKASEERKSI